MKRLHRDNVAGLQGISRPAASGKGVRASSLQIPVHYFAGLILDVNVEVHVGIHPLHFSDDARDCDRFVLVKLGGE